MGAQAVLAQEYLIRGDFASCTSSSVNLCRSGLWSVMSNSARDQAVYFAKLAEQAERYDEMASHMKTVSEMGDELSTEERNLLSVAYKNTVGSRRASWRIVTSVEQKEKSKGNDGNAAWAKEYGSKVEKELSDICNEILKLLGGKDDPNSVISKASNAESKVFYHKMAGDYYRYIAELPPKRRRRAPRRAQNLATERRWTLPRKSSLLRTRSGWAWPSTSRCSTTRSSGTQTRRATWRGRRSRKRSRSLTTCPRNPTRTQRSSCSCSGTT